MSKFHLREIAITAADTDTELTTTGSETAPGQIQVPARATRIRRIIAHAASDNAAVGANVFFLRLSGNGLDGPPHSIAVGGMGGQNATATHSSNSPGLVLWTDIKVRAGNRIRIGGEMTTTDTGTTRMNVTLEFDRG